MSNIKKMCDRVVWVEDPIIKMVNKPDDSHYELFKSL